MRIAILEDDPAQSEAFVAWLRAAGHDVHAFSGAREFTRIAARESFDLCLLDSNLPESSGQEVLRWLREDRNSDAAVIFVTVRDAEWDVVAALAGGADDYIVKPVRRLELIARIDAVLRRVRPASGEHSFEIGPYRFDLARKIATLGGEPVDLTDKEFDLSAFLFRNLGRLISRGHLLEAVWGRDPGVATRTVDTHISRIRTKLQLKPERGFRLTPAYNFGYRLERLADSSDEDAERVVGAV